MKLLISAVVGLGLVLLGKKLMDQSRVKPVLALPSSECDHAEDTVH